MNQVSKPSSAEIITLMLKELSDPVCVTYWCENGKGDFQNRFTRPGISTVLGNQEIPNVSPSECLWLYPTWEAFEEASA